MLPRDGRTRQGQWV